MPLAGDGALQTQKTSGLVLGDFIDTCVASLKGAVRRYKYIPGFQHMRRNMEDRTPHIEDVHKVLCGASFMALTEVKIKNACLFGLPEILNVAHNTIFSGYLVRASLSARLSGSPKLATAECHCQELGACQSLV